VGYLTAQQGSSCSSGWRCSPGDTEIQNCLPGTCISICCSC